MTKEQTEGSTSQSRESCQESFQSSALRTKLGKQNRKTETVQEILPTQTPQATTWPLAQLDSHETLGALEPDLGPDCGRDS